MLRCLHTFNPIFWCFTEADFEDLILRVQVDMEKLNGYENSALNQDPEEGRIVERLEKNFAIALHCLTCMNNNKPNRQLSFLIAEIIGKFGQISLEKGIPCKEILLASLNMHLYSLGFTNDCFQIANYSSLADMKKTAAAGRANDPSFTSSEEFLHKMSVEDFVSQAYSNTFAQPCPDRRLLSLAKTIRWLGNASEHNEEGQPHTHLFALTEALLQIINNDESSKELAQLQHKDT